MSMRMLPFLAAVSAGLVLAGCARDAPPPPTPTPAASVAAVPNAAWGAFVEQFIENYLAAHPAFAVYLGRHEYDGVLPDWSRAGIAREVARLEGQRAEAAAFGDETLTARERFQRDYLIARIDRDLFWLDAVGDPFRNPAFYFDWEADNLDPSPYVTLTYAPPEARLRAVTRYLSNIPKAVAEIRANLAAPLPLTFVDYGIASFGGLAEYYDNDLVEAFAGVGDTALRAEFDAARKAAAAAMGELRDGLREGRAAATDAYALGPQLFARMLADTEGVHIDLEELEAIARDDLARNTAALRAACAAFAPGAEIGDCLAKMSDDKPERGAVETARGELAVLRAHIVSADLATIPGGEEAEVREAPPFARSNFAYINIAGPFDAGQPSIYFIAPPDPSWSAQVQRDYLPGKADLMFTSAHEVWPGHFLQFLRAKRTDWIFGRLFVTYAFGEGWAHYGEELMWDTGFGAGDPEMHIGQLSNALLRDCRFLSAIGLHTQGMSVAASIALFEGACYQDEGTARQQAARGTYDPAYLNYTVGKLLIKQLREDWSRTRGGRAAWKAFHDEFLSYGGPPIPLVRAQMLGGPPETVFWRGSAR